MVGVTASEGGASAKHLKRPSAADKRRKSGKATHFRQKMKKDDVFIVFPLVGVTGFEPMASWSRTMRATICATPR